jgi:hypothetical protein
MQAKGLTRQEKVSAGPVISSASTPGNITNQTSVVIGIPEFH